MTRPHAPLVRTPPQDSHPDTPPRTSETQGNRYPSITREREAGIYQRSGYASSDRSNEPRNDGAEAPIRPTNSEGKAICPSREDDSISVEDGSLETIAGALWHVLERNYFRAIELLLPEDDLIGARDSHGTRFTIYSPSIYLALYVIDITTTENKGGPNGS